MFLILIALQSIKTSLERNRRNLRQKQSTTTKLTQFAVIAPNQTTTLFTYWSTSAAMHAIKFHGGVTLKASGQGLTHVMPCIASACVLQMIGVSCCLARCIMGTMRQMMIRHALTIARPMLFLRSLTATDDTRKLCTEMFNSSAATLIDTKPS